VLTHLDGTSLALMPLVLALTTHNHRRLDNDLGVEGLRWVGGLEELDGVLSVCN
jgi:hypothetical protein